MDNKNSQQAILPMAPSFMGLSGSNTSGIQRLHGANFLPWKRQVTIILKLRGLSDAIEREEVDETIDMQATLVLLETMDDSHRLQVQAEPTARAIMLSLERQYANASAASKHRLLSRYFRCEKEPQDNLNQHVGKLKELRASLASLGERHSEEMFQVVLINSLPSEYGDIMKTWEVTHPDMKTTEFLLNFLQQRETEIKMTTGIGLNVAIKKKSISDLKKTTNCKKCGKRGHWARECPDRSEAEEGETKISLNTGELGPELKARWVSDSGATTHMCNNRAWYKRLSMYDTPKNASVGDGTRVPVLGIGDIDIFLLVNGHKKAATLRNVSYIPTLATNLLSIPVVTNLGMTATFGSRRCEIRKAEQVIATGKLAKTDLFVMDIEVDYKQVALTVSRDLNLHKALGHPGAARMSKLLRDPEIEIELADNPRECGSCISGKAVRASHPSRSDASRASQVGDAVHADLVHLGNKDSEYPYYLLCKDQWSEFCLVYLIETKSKMVDTIKRMLIDFEFGCGRTVKNLHTDNGSEFVNRDVKLLLLQERVVHTTSSPYVKQQNGTAERAVRTVNESARTLLIDSGLEKSLMPEAVKTACYLLNRVPTTRCDQTPYERFIGRKPIMDNLVRFGAETHVIINDKRLEKSAHRTYQGYTVGYTARRNTYRVFLPILGRVIETCDVYFAPHNHSEPDYSTKRDSISNQIVPPPHDTRCQAVDQPAQVSAANATRDRRNGKPYLTGCELNMFFENFRREDEAEDTSRESSSVSTETSHTSGSDQVDPSAPSSKENVYESVSLNAGEMGSSSQNPGPSYRCESEDGNKQRSSSGFRSTLNKIADTIPSMFVAAIENPTTDEPATFREALSGPNASEWSTAIADEFEAHRQNCTWEVIDKPNTGSTLTAKWVFKLKRGINGEIERFKARLVARGYRQRHGIDYDDTFAPVARIETIRTLYALAATTGRAYQHFDVATAFLNGELQQVVLMEPPQGLELPSNKCLLLRKSLYGLKQAPRAWSSKFHQTMNSLGFKQTKADPCLYTDEEKSTFLAVYVDDGLIIGPSLQDCDRLIQRLNNVFKTRTVKGETFLGLELTSNEVEFTMTQTRYINDMLERFGMQDCTPAPSPMADLKMLEGDEGEIDVPYREAIGSLLFCALMTRPDIAFATTVLARHSSKPSQRHWNAVKRVFRYLKGTAKVGLAYPKVKQQIRLEVFTDADWAGCPETRRSTSGCVVLLSGCVVHFRSKRQRLTALSSCEAEYISACDGLTELSWLTNMLEELGLEHKNPTLAVDNMPAMRTLKSDGPLKGTKHIALKYQYAREKVTSGQVQLIHVASEHQRADVLTKPLSAPNMAKMRDFLGIKEPKWSTTTHSG